MAVVDVTGFEESAGDQSAGLDAEFQVKRVPREPFLSGEAGQSGPLFCRWFLRLDYGHEGTLAHGLTEIVDTVFRLLQVGLSNHQTSNYWENGRGEVVNAATPPSGNRRQMTVVRP